MSLINRYKIKYNLDGGMDENLVSQYIKQITDIYQMANTKYNDYMTDKKDAVFLSGSAAILYYLHSLGYDDLIKRDSFESPSDVDLLMVFYTKMKPVIDEIYIGDFKRQNETKVSSATFKNEWTSNPINQFDLTYVPFTGTHWNEVNGVNVLDLKELKSFYEEDKDLTARKGKDYPKIEIIQEIIKRLELTPRPDIIKPGQRYQPKRMDEENSNDHGSMSSSRVAVNLFGFDSPTKTVPLKFDAVTSPEPDSPSSGEFIPRLINFESEITPVKPVSRQLKF